MRQTMGRRIDGLSDVERDRLITAPDFNDGLDWVNSEADGSPLDPTCGCLEGTIADGYPNPEVVRATADAVLYDSADGNMMTVPWSLAPPSVRYPQAVARFGKPRVVRAIKLRAARNHAPSLTTANAPAPALSSTPQHHAVDV